MHGAPSRLLYKFCSGTNGPFVKSGRHAKEGYVRGMSNCGGCMESVEHIVLVCAKYHSQRQTFWDHMKQVLPLNIFEALFILTCLIKLYFIKEKIKVC